MLNGPEIRRYGYFTVAHLSLSVGADDLQIPGRHEESIHLLWGGLVEQSRQEHP